MGTPCPAIIMPVWPVARKSAFMPRAFMHWVIDSAEYFLPIAQSVPTVSKRLPGRFSPVPIGRLSAGARTLTRRAPDDSAVATSSGNSSSRQCRPLTTSMPALAASPNTWIQRWLICPPAGATPMTILFTPCAFASSIDKSGTPKSTRQSSKRN